MPHSVRLDSRSDIERVLSRRLHLGLFPPRLQLGARPELQERVDRLVDACGCGVGAAVSLIATAGYLIYAAAFALNPSALGTLIGTFAAFMLGGLIGKIAGIARARYELHQLLVALRAEVS